MLSPVEQIKDRLDIVDLIGSYIKLDKAGRNYKARCPFHSEKTPSFIVSPERQSFYCFGCQAKGDAFSFIEKFEGLEFKDALKMLAERVGVELKALKKEEIGEINKKDRLLKALDEAATIYQSQLSQGVEVQKYLASRGLETGIINKWRIGWAPHDWRIIYEKLTERGFKEEELFGVGLIKQPASDPTLAPRSDAMKRPYDVFRGRIMFPIFDISGRVIAFSGRLFAESQTVQNISSPKYVNTPETDLFKKSDVLYGLHEAKSEIRRLDYTVMVEGQVDLVMSHQAGVKNTVASSGTALTESHLKRLQKLSNRCIIAYDSDDAGRAAARRSGELALSLGMEVKIASIPEGADPADVILKSAEEWKELLKNSVNLIEFAIDEAVRKTNNNINLAKEVNNSVIPLLSRLQSEMLRSLFVGIASKKTKIPEKSIWVDIEKYTSKSPRVGHVEGESQSSIEPILFSPEEMLAGIIFWQSSKHKSAEGAPPELTENSYKFDEIRVRFEAIVGTEAASLILENSRFDKDTLIFETEARLSGADPYKAAEELLLRIERTVLEQSLFDTARELDKASTALEKEKLRDEAKEISKRISEISNQ